MNRSSLSNLWPTSAGIGAVEIIKDFSGLPNLSNLSNLVSPFMRAGGRAHGHDSQVRQVGQVGLGVENAGVSRVQPRGLRLDTPPEGRTAKGMRA